MRSCEVYSNCSLIKRKRCVETFGVCSGMFLKCVGEENRSTRRLSTPNTKNVNLRAANDEFARVGTICTPRFPFRCRERKFYFNCVRSKGESIRSFVVDKRCPTLETNVKVHVFWWIVFFIIWKQSSGVNFLWIIHVGKDKIKRCNSCLRHVLQYLV